MNGIAKRTNEQARPWLEKKYGTVLKSDLSASETFAVSEPWTPPLKGSPHLWPKDSAFVEGSPLKNSAYCQPFRPSSRLSHMSYASLHTLPPATGTAHPQSLSNSRGPGRDFMAGAGTKVNSAQLIQRQPGDNPMVG